MSSSSPTVTRTQVAVVGAGPAGLMLTHLLHLAGIDSVAIDLRARREIEETHRAGILEEDSVRLLVDSGASTRVLSEGVRHDGIELGFGGALHRIDFADGCGSSTRLYPQTEIFIDLADVRARDGGDVRFGVTDVAVGDLTGHPAMWFTDAEGTRHEVRADILVGADGSRSVCRRAVPEDQRRQFFREYPFAWFGILCEAPPSADELIYNHSEQGFALISQRTAQLQRMYFQCAPDDDPDAWSEDRIWTELQNRLQANGHTLKEGPIIDKSVLPFRSFVQEPMRYGAMALAGDAAHTVPPTGAKGLNLALADVRVLAETVQTALGSGDLDALDVYSERALARVWKAQYFSYWMTTLLHRLPDAEPFDVRRQIGELSALAESAAGSSYLAQAYCGWPAHSRDRR
jgi:p-hydroxybenzoate 3-monooxygenase